MGKSPEYDLVCKLPVIQRTTQESGKEYSMILDFTYFGYDSGGPSEECILDIMTPLGKRAEGVTVSRMAIDYTEVASNNLGNLRRTVIALAKGLGPVAPATWLGNANVPKEVIYPRPENP